MDKEIIVEMKHITKLFPGVVANDDISVSIQKGEIYALLGENGAGKSTLMSILFGLYQPDHGEIYIRGQKVTLESSRTAAELGIGMVHQHFKLIDNYTIAENIILCREPIHRMLGFLPTVDLKKANKEIRELSQRYHLEVDPEQKIEDINVSIQQRVEILKMLYREADILIFDEPTAILTPQEIEYLLDIMQELRRNGKTIILITHKLEEVKKIANRCAILRRGKLIKVLDVSQTSTLEMANLMVGKDFSFEINKTPAHRGEVVLDIEHLSVRSENKVEVVHDVSFKVHQGEIFAIAGVSGNGQVEIADAIAGLIPVHSGTIRLNGRDITNLDVRERTEAGISYIPEDRQQVGMVADMTLAENMAIKSYYREPFAKRGILQPEVFKNYAEKLVRDYDVRTGSGVDTPMGSLSGGNQQKVLVAREIGLNSVLMIFVQPTRGLDIGAISYIHHQILDERGKGKAILLISLELSEIMDLADTIGVIFRGELLKIEDASKMTTSEVGRYMMGVKE